MRPFGSTWGRWSDQQRSCPSWLCRVLANESVYFNLKQRGYLTATEDRYSASQLIRALVYMYVECGFAATLFLWLQPAFEILGTRPTRHRVVASLIARA